MTGIKFEFVKVEVLEGSVCPWCGKAIAETAGMSVRVVYTPRRFDGEDLEFTDDPMHNNCFEKFVEAGTAAADGDGEVEECGL